MGVWINKRKGKHTYMKDLNLHEEIIKSLKLISYDRSLTLMEQSFWETQWETQGGVDPNFREDEKNLIKLKDKQERINKRQEDAYSILRKKSEQRCNTLLSKEPKDQNKKIAKEVFLVLKKEVGEQKPSEIKKPSTWADPSSWGTNEEDILSALKKITNKYIYIYIFEYIWACYPEHQGKNILKFLQDTEFSKGDFQSTGGGVTGSQSYQWEYNDKWLRAYENILKKITPSETYEKEYNFDGYGGIKSMLIPPLVREGLHVLLPLFSILVTAVSGGAFAGYATSGLIEIADALVYVADNDVWMAGLSLFFAIIPVGKLFTLIPALRKLVATAGRKSINKFISKLAGKIDQPLTELEKEVLQDMSLIAVREELTRTILMQGVKNVIKRSLVGKGIYAFFKLIFKLIKLGYLSAEFLINFGLVMVGGFWCWGKIAVFLGIKTKEEIESITGKELKDKNIPKSLPNIDISNVIIDYFKDTISVGGSFSDRWSGKFNIGVLSLQLFLMKSGNNKITYNSKDITKFTADEINALYRNTTNPQNYTMGGLRQKEGKRIFVFINERPEKGKINVGDKIEITNTSFNGIYDVKNIYYQNNKIIGVYIDSNFRPKGDVDLSFKNKGQIKYKGKSDKNVVAWDEMPETNKGVKTVNFKWGYFDNNTKESVETYQIKNDLTPDGIAGPKTLNKIISDLKLKKYGPMQNTSGINIYDEIQNSKINITEKDNEVTKQDIKTEYVDQTKQVTDSLQNSINTRRPVTDADLDYLIIE
jgi:peptidoglycan hydrolase-like protein with peptidoglycan-binding domain